MIVGEVGSSARYAFIDRSDGVGDPPYDRGNIAAHVGAADSDIAKNLAVLAGGVGLASSALVTMTAVHGSDVVEVRSSGLIPRADAMVSSAEGLGLVVMAGDCVPVLIAADGAIGVAHAGWRGVVADVVGTAVTRLRELTSGPVHAVVGPAICGRCYDVDTSRWDTVVSASASAAAPHGRLDLPAAVLDRLQRLDVVVEHIDECTRESSRWFSYRRDGVTGRHGGVVARTDPSGTDVGWSSRV